jgi:putative SOS response-associated peptidase YedK
MVKKLPSFYYCMMCGRFTLHHTWPEIVEAMDVVPTMAKGRNDPARYNIAPTQTVPFIHGDDGEVNVLDGQWWLIPVWAKEQPKYPTFNARSETAHEKNSFKASFKSKRCLIPADGYYGWTKGEDGGRTRTLYALRNMSHFLALGTRTSEAKIVPGIKTGIMNYRNRIYLFISIV